MRKCQYCKKRFKKVKNAQKFCMAKCRNAYQYLWWKEELKKRRRQRYYENKKDIPLSGLPPEEFAKYLVEAQ